MGKKKKKKARKRFVKKLKKFLQIVSLITGIFQSSTQCLRANRKGSGFTARSPL